MISVGAAGQAAGPALPEAGRKGLISGHRGKVSGTRIPEAIRGEVLELVRQWYADSGPTLAHEYLVSVPG